MTHFRSGAALRLPAGSSTRMITSISIHLTPLAKSRLGAKGDEGGVFIWVSHDELNLCVTSNTTRTARELAARLIDAADWVDKHDHSTPHSPPTD